MKNMINLKNETLLVIAPHADDEILGCGGLISKIKKAGGKVYVLIFNAGSVHGKNKEEATKIWKKETASAMKLLKVDEYDIIFSSDKDNRFLDIKPIHTLIDTIETTSLVSLKKIKPSIVAIPTNHSHHQDHVRVFEASIAALRPLGSLTSRTVISYEAPEHSKLSVSGVFEPNFYIDIENEIDKKIQAFYKYKNQVRPGVRDKLTIKNQAAYRGHDVGKKYCEAYLIHRFVF